MSLPDRNIWISSRVPRTLPCSNCGRTSHYNDLRQPDLYEYTCGDCHDTQQFTLSQINAIEASRFHKVSASVSNIISISAKR